jgi:Bax protein
MNLLGVPSSREEDADHEVRKFNDARESVFAYVDNLNSNPAYRELRQIRAQLRAENKPVTGLELVHGLDHYSQRGQEYIDEIESLIEYNQLWRFNLDHQIAQENTDEAASSN